MAKKISNQEGSRAFNEQIADMEKQLKKLAIDYNRFFAGDLKKPPQQRRLVLERQLRELTTANHGPQAKFKVLNFSSTYSAMRALWNRKISELETGRKVGRRYARADRVSDNRIQTFLRSSKADANSPAARLQKRRAAAAQQVPPIQGIFDQLTNYQRAMGVEPSFSSAAQLGKYLAMQKAKIEKQTGWTSVKLKITVKDGKLHLKAQPPDPPKG